MAIIVDLNQVVYKSFFASVGSHTNIPADLVPMRNLTLNTLRLINSKFRGKYGKMILASDWPGNWRSDAFPQYKYRRKKSRSQGDIDWSVLHKSMNALREELIENFPYLYVQVSGAEADDIIGVLTDLLGKTEPVMIVSGDKDFRQLQIPGRDVDQYDPVQRKEIVEPDAIAYLQSHILTGDKDDDIPNVLSDDNVFVDGIRQTSLTAPRKAQLEGVQNRPEDKYYQNWKRNSLLIDLQNTPQPIKDEILGIYETGPKVSDRSGVLEYLRKHRLGNLQQHLSDF